MYVLKSVRVVVQTPDVFLSSAESRAEQLRRAS
jgi:hypothetical protein